MGSRFSFDSRFVARTLAAIATAIVFASCSFIPDEPTYFVQQGFPDFSMRAVVNQTFGATPAAHPHFAFAYQVYFTDPVSVSVTPISVIDNFPAQILTRCRDTLTQRDLNRGFALGYGNYVLGVGFLIVFDDLNANGDYDAGEPTIGGSNNEVLVYLQGTPTRDLLDQFGALETGYNLCMKTQSIRGVDLFQVSPTRQATITIPKAGGAVLLPRLR